jgi:hypothetical protein
MSVDGRTARTADMATALRLLERIERMDLGPKERIELARELHRVARRIAPEVSS